MDELGLTQDGLAQKAGVSQVAIHKLLTGKARQTRKLAEIALALETTAEWLAAGTEAISARDQVESNIKPGPTIKGRVPLISKVQAGAWTEIVDNFSPGDAEDWFPCPVSHSPKTFALRIQGESMYNPSGSLSFRDGELIFVDPDRPAVNGSYVVVRLDSETEATFKKLIIEGDTQYLVSINPAWPNRIIEIKGDATICGVAIFKGETL